MDFPIYPPPYCIFKIFPSPYYLDPRLSGTVEYINKNRLKDFDFISKIVTVLCHGTDCNDFISSNLPQKFWNYVLLSRG